MTASMRDPGPWALDLDGHQAWMLELLNGTHEVDDSQVRARLADSFLAQVSPDGLASVVVGVSGRPWTVAAVVEDRPAARALELVSPSGEHLRLTLATDADGRLLGATVLGSTPCPDAVAPDDAELSPALASGLLWLTSVVEADRDVSPDELAERIHPDFLSEVGADAFAAGLDDIQALGPLELRFFERRPTATRLVARVGVFSGEEARVRLEVEEGGMGRITAASVITTSPCYAPG